MTDVERLVEFVLAQIADDEAAARAASHGGRWRYEVGDSIAAWTLYDEHWNIASMTTYDTESYDYSARMPAFRSPGYVDPDANGRHIARHDPARVLAECAAKRAIVEDCVDILDNPDEYTAHERDIARDHLQHLAQPYVDRPGFDPAWKVET